MAYEFELLSPTDKPALLGLSTLEFQARVMAVLDSLGYKVHAAQNQDDFMSRFTYFQYQVVVLEEIFDCNAKEENRALYFIQNLPMSMRRHAVVILLGDDYQTLHPMQAFAESVHAVVHSTGLDDFEMIVKKATSDNELFQNIYRQVQDNIAKGKVE